MPSAFALHLMGEEHRQGSSSRTLSVLSASGGSSSDVLVAHTQRQAARDGTRAVQFGENITKRGSRPCRCHRALSSSLASLRLHSVPPRGQISTWRRWGKKGREDEGDLGAAQATVARTLDLQRCRPSRHDLEPLSHSPLVSQHLPRCNVQSTLMPLISMAASVRHPPPYYPHSDLHTSDLCLYSRSLCPSRHAG